MRNMCKYKQCSVQSSMSLADMSLNPVSGKLIIHLLLHLSQRQPRVHD